MTTFRKAQSTDKVTVTLVTAKGRTVFDTTLAEIHEVLSSVVNNVPSMYQVEIVPDDKLETYTVTITER